LHYCFTKLITTMNYNDVFGDFKIKSLKFQLTTYFYLVIIYFLVTYLNEIQYVDLLVLDKPITVFPYKDIDFDSFIIPPGAAGWHKMQFSLKMTDLRLWQQPYFYMYILGVILKATIVIIILNILRKMAITLDKNEPFQEKNIHRFSSIGILVIVYFFCDPLENYGIRYLIRNLFFPSKNIYYFQYKLLSFWVLHSGVFFTICSEILKKGFILKQENDLTI
jgi:Protein of unknown function (DUF2975)